METFKTKPRSNYMSLADKAQDLTTNYLINLIQNLEKLTDQLTIMRELEKRLNLGELTEDVFYNTLEQCNGK
jgi:hypothetical protein